MDPQHFCCLIYVFLRTVFKPTEDTEHSCNGYRNIEPGMQQKFQMRTTSIYKCSCACKFFFKYLCKNFRAIPPPSHFPLAAFEIFQSIFLGSMLPQHMALCLILSKKNVRQGRRLRFGMLTVLTNIRSTNVLHHASCIMHHAS